MRFLVDGQLPMQLAIHLRGRGHDCSHVLDLNLGQESDAEIWRLAGADGSIVISKDEDFLFLANRPRETGFLIWVRLGNCRNSALLSAFDKSLDDIVRAIESGQRVIELR